jgi:phage antirepressor YoqD-like protein
MWKIAKFLNIGENTLYRWLRDELTDETRSNILSAISKIKEGQTDDAGSNK